MQDEIFSIDNLIPSMRNRLAKMLAANVCHPFTTYWKGMGHADCNSRDVSKLIFGLGEDSPFTVKCLMLNIDHLTHISSVERRDIIREFEMSCDPEPVLVFRSGSDWIVAEGGERMEALRLRGHQMTYALDVSSFFNIDYKALEL